MKKNNEYHLSSAIILISTSLYFAGHAFADDKTPGQIHDYPDGKTNAYSKSHQLSFEYPHDGLARAEFKSEEFYAIILKSAERCSFSEEDRAQIQNIFPENKVFMNLFDCEDPEDNITYTNTNNDFAFIAVFGGHSLEQANQLLKDYDLATKFPGANIRKMQAVLVHS